MFKKLFAKNKTDKKSLTEEKLTLEEEEKLSELKQFIDEY